LDTDLSQISQVTNTFLFLWSYTWVDSCLCDKYVLSHSIHLNSPVPSSCPFFLWSLNCWLVSNMIPQETQIYFVSLWIFLICLLKISLWENLLSHWSHLNGLVTTGSVCGFSCIFICFKWYSYVALTCLFEVHCFWAKFLSQIWHPFAISDVLYSQYWTCGMILLCVVFNVQIGQVNSISLRIISGILILLCVISICRFLKVSVWNLNWHWEHSKSPVFTGKSGRVTSLGSL